MSCAVLCRLFNNLLGLIMEIVILSLCAFTGLVISPSVFRALGLR